MYSIDEMKKYTSLLMFVTTPEDWELLKKQDYYLAQIVSEFHLASTILHSLNKYVRDGIVDVPALSIYLADVAFVGLLPVEEVEKKIKQFLPSLLERGLIDKDYNATGAGKELLNIRAQAYYSAQHASQLVH